MSSSDHPVPSVRVSAAVRPSTTSVPSESSTSLKRDRSAGRRLIALLIADTRSSCRSPPVTRVQKRRLYAALPGFSCWYSHNALWPAVAG